MYNSKVRNIELPENLFSNLGEIKSRKIEKEPHPPITNTKNPSTSIYNFENDVKLTNYSNRQEYRNRIDKMYEDIKELKPIDNEIDTVLYFNNYVEKGIVVNPKISSLKQFWTEYRLINNEKAKKYLTKESPIQKNKNLDDFDTLFDALSARVSEINKYIDELKEMRTNINISNTKLERDKEKLSEERERFQSYKKAEEHKIKEEKQNLKINFDRLQTIIDDLDKKLVSINKVNE